MKRLLLLFPLLSALATEIRFEGVIANSGTLEHPVQAGSVRERCVGMGVAFDEASGRLFTRIGNDRLSAYTMDGRCVASWKLPASENEWDRLVLCNETLVLLINQTLYRLPLAAPDGALAERINAPSVKPTALSASAHNGRVMVLQKEGALVSLDPLTGTCEPYGELRGNFGVIDGMDWGIDGHFYVITGREVHQFIAGKETLDSRFPKRFIGNREAGATRTTRLGHYWFGSAWHGTVKRFTADFEPAPGVVLGGASGHFIGHVICNYELDVALGFAEIRPGVYALGAFNGTIQIAQWNRETKKLELVRRIGPLPCAAGLAVDANGKIFAHQNVWQWNDGPLAPAEFGVPAAALSPATWMTPETVVMLSLQWGKLGAIFGPLEDGQLRTFRSNVEPKKEAHIVGLIATHARSDRQGKEGLLAVDAEGICEYFELSGDPRNIAPQSMGSGKMRFTKSGCVTAAIMKRADILLAAHNGELVELVRAGNDWHEQTRHTLPVSGTLRLAQSKDRIVVAEVESGRIALFDATLQHQLAALQTPASPAVIAVNGPFLAIYDARGQRLLKYRILD